MPPPFSKLSYEKLPTFIPSTMRSELPASTAKVLEFTLRPNPPIAKIDAGRTAIMIPINNFFILNSL